ncbi:MAG: site-2 protease family protein [Flavobacteriales bacterium]|nr:site-2 protease family protein [Flavobacteriales bacterium]
MAAGRRTSLTLFTFKGIQVRMHWSFPLLLGWVILSALTEGMDLPHMMRQLLYLLIVFCCVVLHEFGHALTALRFGIRTHNILLLPIGGLARLERMPEKPAQELLVTLAGPAVNLAIVLLVGVPSLLLGYQVLGVDPMADPLGPLSLIGFVMLVNAGLFLFNLIPAFPMDGGRVLRSLLAFRTDRVRATRIAATVGKVFAVGFIIAAFIWQQPSLGLIGLFVFFGASAEMNMVKTQHALSGVRVRDVMRTRFWTMPHDTTIRSAAEELLAGGEHVVVVTRHGDLDRLVQRAEIIAAVQLGQEALPLESIPGKVVQGVAPDVDMKEAHHTLSVGASTLIPVVDQGRIVGVLDMDNLSEYLELHERTGRDRASR